MQDLIHSVCDGPDLPCPDKLRQLHQTVSTLRDPTVITDLVNWIGVHLSKCRKLEHLEAFLQILQPLDLSLVSGDLPISLTQSLLSFSGLSNLAHQIEEPEIPQDIILLCMKIIELTVQSHPVAPDSFCQSGLVEGLINRIKTFRDPRLNDVIKLYDVRILNTVLVNKPELVLRVSHDLHGFIYLIEVLDLIIEEMRPNSLTADRISLISLVLKLLSRLAVDNDRGSLSSDEEAHFLRLVSFIHDLLAFFLDVDDAVISVTSRHALTEQCVELLGCVPAIAYEELITPDESDFEIRNYEGKNLDAIIYLLDYLLHVIMEHDMNRIVCALKVLIDACISQRIIRKFLRSWIFPASKLIEVDPLELNAKDKEMMELEPIYIELCKLVNAKDFGHPFSACYHASLLLFILCKEDVNKVVQHTGQVRFWKLAPQLQLNREPEIYSSDSSDDEGDVSGLDLTLSASKELLQELDLSMKS